MACKFKNGEKIFFIGTKDYPKLEKYEMVIAMTTKNYLAQDHTGNIFIHVKTSEGSICCWYNENDFINIYEYRKLKMIKINKND